VLMAATLPLVLVACNETVKPKTTDRAGARVNGSEVGQRHTAYALERAIDQEVIVQRALAEGLDRDPDVAQRLEAARRAVITQAWFDRLAASGGAADAQERVRALRREARIEYVNPPAVASLF
jgi:peptidyl-prolyl cis-trans isomerase C